MVTTFEEVPVPFSPPDAPDQLYVARVPSVRVPVNATLPGSLYLEGTSLYVLDSVTGVVHNCDVQIPEGNNEILSFLPAT